MPLCKIDLLYAIAYKTQVTQNVFIAFYLGCKDVIRKRSEKNILKSLHNIIFLL